MAELAARLAAALYGVGVRCFHGGYDRGWFRAGSLPRPVVSVGNLVAGGSGKTPAVLELARATLAAGIRPAILTRGYGGRRSGILLHGRWENGPEARAGDAGDEPVLLSRRLPTVPVVIGRKRVRGGHRVLGLGIPVDVFLLDDGFQHRNLRRDRDLVLLDAVDPFAGGELLPAGPLREPPVALRRAHHLLLTVKDSGTPIPPGTELLLRDHVPHASWTRAWTVFHGLTPLAPGMNVDDAPVPTRVLAVAGIARPRRFRALLERAAIDVAETRWFRDHHRFTPGEVKNLEARAVAVGGALVTTAKDAVRLEGLTASPWWVADVSLEVDGGWDVLLRSLVPAPKRA